jgi:ubiquinone/menaquinone biosynthesis C-methylase UbiE
MSIFTNRRAPESMKRFYNWYNKYYAGMEKTFSPTIGEAIEQQLSKAQNLENKTALEYACGTGFLTTHIAPLFKNVTAKDASTGMLNVAKKRIEEKGFTSKVELTEGNVLDITEYDKTYDYVFMSFALHLFSPQDQENILKKMLDIAKEKVIIIDHKKKWEPITAFVEWIEGSYYDKFIKMDFKEIAGRLNVKQFSQDNRKYCVVLTFESR